MSTEALSTLSKSEAERNQREDGHTIVAERTVDLVPIADLVRANFPDRRLDFVSIDVEGIDFEIVQNFDFDFVRPSVLCVETLEYRKLGEQRKATEIIEAMTAHDYKVYADTFINTIFVDERLWSARN